MIMKVLFHPAGDIEDILPSGMINIIIYQCLFARCC